MTELSGFESIQLIISIVSTGMIAILFRYIWKTKSEKLFDDNIRKTAKIIFEQLALINSFKKGIFEILENEKNYDMNKQSWHTFSQGDFNEMFRWKKLIKKQCDTLSTLKSYGNITLDQYGVVQGYALSAYSFLNKISNMDYTASVDQKSLEFHMYYAKQLIQSFGNLTPKHFKDMWNREFRERGGIDLISKPSLEPGDTVGPYFNIWNSLFFYDPYFTKIYKTLEENRKTLEYILSYLSERDFRIL